MPPQMPGGEHTLQRSRGRRPRRRSRSGDGVVLANRKTEICLHWQKGCCPYGAGSCAFAHGIGELRHPTLDDEAIARSVSEDSGSCPSSRDATPCGRRGVTIGRVPPSPCERRLPTFVGLSTGTTPKRGGGSSRRFSSPGMSHAYGHGDGQQRTPQHQRSLSSPYPSPSSAFSDSYGFGVAVDAPPLSPPCFHRGDASSSSSTHPHFSESLQRHSRAAAAAVAHSEAFAAAAYGRGGDRSRYGRGSYPSASSPASGLASPVSWSNVDANQQQQHHQHHHRQQRGGGGGAGYPTRSGMAAIRSSRFPGAASGGSNSYLTSTTVALPAAAAGAATRAPFDTVTSPSTAYATRENGGGGGGTHHHHHHHYHHRHHRRTSSDSSPGGAASAAAPGGPWSPGSWAPMAQQLDAVYLHQREGGFGGPGGGPPALAVGLFARQGPLPRRNGGGDGRFGWG